MDNTIVFPVGSRVKKTGSCYYSHSGDNSGIEKNKIGIVMKIGIVITIKRQLLIIYTLLGLIVIMIMLKIS